MTEQTGLVERLGEALFVLSDAMLKSGFFERPQNHTAYENVVAAFQALSDSPVKGSEAMTDLAEAVQSWRDHFEPDGKRIRLEGADKKGICVMLDRVLAVLPNTSVGQGD